MPKTVIIGDVHGQQDQLDDLLLEISDVVGHSSNEYDIVFVGDLVDRGPQSASVVQFVSAGVQQGRFSCVLGNHDEMFLQALLLFRRDLFLEAGIDLDAQEALVQEFRFAPLRVLYHWLDQGGMTTISSFHGKPAEPETWNIPPETVSFLTYLPLVWSNGDVTVTHARAHHWAIEEGLAKLHTPWKISPRSRMSLLWNRESVVSVKEGIHVCGHTPRPRPVEDGRTREIDTGCAYGGLLTAYIVEDDHYIGVSCVS